MSRRFGRNQRRRLREELSQATADKTRFETAWQQEVGLTMHMRERNDRARETLLEIYEMVSRYSFVTPPLDIEVDDPRQDKLRLLGLPPRMFSADLDTLQTVTVYAVQVAVQEDCFRHAFHATLTYNGESVAYALSEEVILNSPESALRGRIEREIAPRLVAELIKKIRGRRRV